MAAPEAAPPRRPLRLLETPLFWLLSPLYLHGHFAVQIFWVISGAVFFLGYLAPIREAGFDYLGISIDGKNLSGGGS